MTGGTPYEDEQLFDHECLQLVQCRNWTSLESKAKFHLQRVNPQSFKAFFYFGISQFRQHKYPMAILSFEKAEQINPEDVQLQYNLALANFKSELYPQTVEHLKRVITMDPKHPHAYNNLAFLYNMHQLYGDTIQTCR